MEDGRQEESLEEKVREEALSTEQAESSEQLHVVEEATEREPISALARCLPSRVP